MNNQQRYMEPNDAGEVKARIDQMWKIGVQTKPNQTPEDLGNQAEDILSPGLSAGGSQVSLKSEQQWLSSLLSRQPGLLD
ncbi:hypothetical protein N7486_008470 [Penicillium sp. IBT 16267x]|nr:hypothetical protein N7486_008470 [Penicillium sp. IBT 16267x]